MVEAVQEASEARLDVSTVEERADLEALQPSAQILFWSRLDVVAELLADHLDIVEDVRIANLELPQQVPQYIGGILPLEGVLGPQGVVSCLRVILHELDEQMPAHLVLHRSMILL